MITYIISVIATKTSNEQVTFYICDDVQEWLTNNIEWAQKYYSLKRAEEEVKNSINNVRYDLEKVNCKLKAFVIQKQIIKYKDVKRINF